MTDAWRDIVRRIQELPGQQLFEYLDEDGERATDRLGRRQRLPARGRSGPTSRAKDFRTWAGTVLAFRAFRRVDEDDPLSRTTPGGARPSRRWPSALGNTPAVSRASYVHPAVVEAWQDGDLHAVRLTTELPSTGPPTREEEAAVIRLLERRRRRGGHARPRPPRGQRAGPGAGS